MAEREGLIGGFVASNKESGKIEDCYCATAFNGSNTTSGGFVAENSGSIRTSFCFSRAKGVSGGFAGRKMDFGKGCFFILGKKNQDELWDRMRGVRKGQLVNERQANELGYDTKSIWECTGRKVPLQFQNRNWFYQGAFAAGAKDILPIRDRKSLIRFAELVNQGDKRAINAKVILEADINLRGMTWIPIGKERKNAFCGTFDGNGHTVRNFVIKGDGLARKGFFGYQRGRVYNLSLDCQMKGDGEIGGIAAVNEGTIGCCGVTMGCVGKGHNFQIGGFVGVNSGHIFQSYVAGKVRLFALPLVPFFILLCSAAVVSAAAFAPAIPSDDQPIYNEVESDPDQEKIEDSQENGGGSQTASEEWKDPEWVDNPDEEDKEADELANHFSFMLASQITIDCSNRYCYMDFANPSGANYKLKAVLVMSEETAQKATDGSFAVKNGEVIIAESKAVDPGYRIEAFKLGKSVTKHLKKGNYAATVRLIPYNVENNDKGMVDTNMPVSLTIL